MSGEFDGAPLVAGTVRGIRRFRVDELGRLRSPQQGTVWRPGDNTAECRRDQQLAAQIRSVNKGYSQATITAVASFAKNVADLGRPPDHSLASCRCGYYAYSDGGDAAEYGGNGTVAAVVEGWGDVMLGTRGFRAQHARVLAVCLPEDSHRTPLDGLAYVTALRLGRPYRFGWVWLVYAVFMAVVGGMNVFRGEASGPWQLGLAVIGALFAFWPSNDERDRRIKQGVNGINRINGSMPLPVTTTAAVRANYSDVAFYSTYDAMVAAWPLHPGDRPTPATDPTFWERP